MPIMNFDLQDGKPPVSFSINNEGAERFMAFMAECVEARNIAQRAASSGAKPAAGQDRTPNPYTIGTPEAYWRRGYNGERMIGHPNCAAEKFYNEGKKARKIDDAKAAAGVPHIERDAALIPDLRLAQVVEARTIGYHSAQLIMKSQDEAGAFCAAVNAALAAQHGEKAPGAV